MPKRLIFKKIKFSIFVFLFVLLSALNGNSQTFTSSNLPIVVINTDLNTSNGLPREIVDDVRVLGNMKIIKHTDGTRNYLADINSTEYLNYDGRINIEIRGSSSQSLPKKPYGLTTLQEDNASNNNVSLLDMPKENDWVLNSLAFDPSLIRDYFSYSISRQMGNYAPRTEYCEVILNGEYIGLYLLQEKIKADSDRVNILKITDTDTSSPDITGGYITKSDKTTGGDPVAWTMSSYSWSASFIHDLPKPEDVTAGQNSYIYSVFLNLASTSKANNISLSTGFPSIIDIPSFIDFMLSNELASNPDGYQFSTYYHKDRNGKLRAGPIWDFNLTYGNDLFDSGYDRSKYNVWQFNDGENDGPKFWTDLFRNPTFKCYLSKRWNLLTQTNNPMNYDSMSSLIDNTSTYIAEAREREKQKWDRIPDYDLEIKNLKSFLSKRITWMTNNIGSYTGCSSMITPPLVITKINYNPTISSGFTESNDLEFIEIKNNGNATVDLTGIYFRELGMTYQFPKNATINANQSIFLASNSAVFQSKYGIVAFDQFTRNLSNKSQKLILSDGYGNTIDSVEYLDDVPWPKEADGNGSFLQLISTTLDNSLASSWKTSTTNVLTTNSFITENDVIVYPNPATNFLNISAKNSIDTIEIIDVFGKIIKTYQLNTNEVQLDLSTFSKGFYFVKISNNDGVKLEKIVKQ